MSKLATKVKAGETVRRIRKSVPEKAGAQVSESKTRPEWAAEIIAAHKQSIEGILKMGRTLIAAKDALDHGMFLEMIEHDLPFDASTAQRLMKIAGDGRITNPAHVQLLPWAWGTLYEISKLPDAAFNEALSSGAINPQMTRTEAVQLAAPSRPRAAPSKPRAAPSKPHHQPEIVVELSEEEEGGTFLRRVDQAKACARYSGEVTNEIIELAKSVAEAWNELVIKLMEQRV